MSYFSAAILWDIPYIEAVLGKETTEKNSVDFTVAKRSARLYGENRNFHLCELPLPKGAVVEKSEKMVASPELLFVQLATKLDFHRLILLGLQLCSYSPGKPQTAITTKLKLQTFIGKLSGVRGCRKALKAIEYIEEGSGSIMESLVYMILTLPHSLGGYGLNGAVFNHEIKLSDQGAIRLGQNRCFVDLYYSSAKLAIEYDSFAFHRNPSEQGRDAVRAEILGRQGIDVLHLTTIQLYDRKACEDFAINLAARLGKRIRIRAKKFRGAERDLRNLLPTEKQSCLIN